MPQITLAAPAGPNPPIDPTSVEKFKNDYECTQFLSDEAVKTMFASALPLTEVKLQDFDALFYPGG